jgi:hypothetical protein
LLPTPFLQRRRVMWQDCNGLERFDREFISPHGGSVGSAYGDFDAASATVSRCAKPDRTTMSEYSADGLIARLAPSVIDHFQGRGAIDFRVAPGEPDRLHVSILFSHGLDPLEAMAGLKSVAERAGLLVADERTTQHSVSIAVPVARQVHGEIPRPSIVWAAPSAAVAIADDLRESIYAAARNQPVAGWGAHALGRLLSATWSRWRSVLQPTKPLQPAGVK